MGFSERELLARTLQAEAGNQGLGGMMAAGSVIMNRANSSGYGDGVSGVILKPGQFSAWNSQTGYAGGEQGQDMNAMRASADAYKAAETLLSGNYQDSTNGATHYYNPSISNPAWGQRAGGEWTRQGDHIFGRAEAGRGASQPQQQTRYTPMEPEEPKGLLGSLGIQKMEEGATGETGQRFYKRDSFKDTAATLSQAFASMGSNRGVQAFANNVAGQRTEKKAKNKTIDYLRRNGMNQEADMIESGALRASDLMTTLANKRLGATTDPTAIRALKQQAQLAGLKEGTPEYQAFMLNGGGNPAAFLALEQQAQAAGLAKGSPEYQEFMLTRGKGDQAFAAQAGKNEANIDTGGEATAAVEGGKLEAKAGAEDAAALREMKRNMPGLEVVVGQLHGLSDTATYTAAGRLADEVRKQLGLDPSDSAVDRAEYIAVVDNQVLPLLRQTFGAAFTAKEGDTLRATLGDPNKSPSEKKAVLNAFIEQKKRDLEAMQQDQRQEAPAQTQPANGDDPLGLFQ